MGKPFFLLVDSNVLSPVFLKVLKAKELLQNSKANSTTEAARMAGISRSVFYKYKDAVFAYKDSSQESIITVQVVLYDRPGVLLSVISEFYSFGANILTINQNIPVKGRTVVSISARTDNMKKPLNEFLEELQNVDGVKTIENIASV